MTPDRTFSSAIMALLDVFGGHAHDHANAEMRLEPSAVRIVAAQLRGMHAVAIQLEDARAERDDLRAIAADLDVVMLDKDGVPSLRHMHAAVAPLAMAIPGTNVVTFPSAGFSNRGGAA